MKKNVIIGICVFVAIFLTSAVSYGVNIMSERMQPKSPSDYHIGVTYDEAMNGEKPVIALFYVNWCGFCRRFMPKFNTLAKIYGKQYNFLMINAEDETKKDLVEDVRLTGYPTVYVIDPKYNNRFLLNNAIYMDMSKFRVEIERYSKIRGILDKSTECASK